MMLGAWELVVVAIAALLFLGPEKLPELARTLARLLAQVQSLASEARRSVNDALHEDDVPRRAALPVSEAPVTSPPPAAHPSAAAEPEAAESSAAAKADAAAAAAPFSAWVEREHERMTQSRGAQAPDAVPTSAPHNPRIDDPSVAALKGDEDS